MNPGLVDNWRIRDGIAVVLLPYIVFVLVHLCVFMVLAASSDPSIAFDDDWLFGISLMIAGPVGGLLAYLYVRHRSVGRLGEPFHAGFGIRLPERRWVLPTAGASLVLIGLAFAVAQLPFPVEHRNQLLDTIFATLSSTERAFFVVSVVLIGPLVEEFIHRGVVFGTLAAKYGVSVAVIGSTLIFTAVHLSIAHDDIVGLMQITLVGGVLVALRIYFRSIIPCIAGHAIYNAVPTFGMLGAQL